MNRPDDVLDAIRSDIERIRSDQRWCFFDGYQPSGANPDRVAGVNPQDIIGRDTVGVTDPARLDIGVGDPQSRAAYLETAWLITFLDMRLVRALRALDPEQPPLYVVVSTVSTLEARDQALRIAELRVGSIASSWHDVIAGEKRWQREDRQREARGQLKDAHLRPPSARAAADLAVRTLARALSRGPVNGAATPERLCKNCKLRPVGERTGNRCTTCAQYRWRTGEERPRSLDSAELSAPHAAAARRQARGEGWGNA